jgi:inorganic pyrophosphatase
MTNIFHDLSTFVKSDENKINIIIEIPKGSMVKYELDHETGYIMVDRVGRTPIPYNFNYGDIPMTWNEWDDDPLDAIVLSRHAFHPGSVVPCRVVWGLKMIDGWEFDYKVLVVADDKYYDDVSDIDDVEEKEKEDIYYFMKHYKDLHNKKVELEWWDSKNNAMKIIKESVDFYKIKFNR